MYSVIESECPIEFRAAGPEDQAAIDWYNAVASYGAHRGMVVQQSHVDRLMALPRVAEYSAGFGRPGDIGFVALSGQQTIVGAVWGRHYNRADTDPLADYPFEITIGVADDYRGRGIGKTLLAKIVAGAAASGVEHVALGVSVHNPSARRLYERSGWRQIYVDGGLVGGEYAMMVRQTTTDR